MQIKETKEGGVNADIPRRLYLSVVRIMGRENAQWEAACEKAASLLDESSENFDRRVEVEVQRRQASELFARLNKARKTIESKAFSLGKEVGRKEAEIYFPCSVCREPIAIDRDGEAHKAVMELMQSARWGHRGCHEKTGAPGRLRM